MAVQIDLLHLRAPLQPTVLAGETWRFQAWSRDWNPGPTSNRSDALAVNFR
jgi:hypothetical protein